VHPRIYKEFERLLDQHPPPGKDVLELGAPPKRTSLLTAVLQRDPTAHCVGINIKIGRKDPSLPYEMVKGNANNLSMFGDQSFDAVLTNSMLEHDQAFWLTLAEVRRVLKPGGLFYAGVPAYRNAETTSQRMISRLRRSRLRDGAVAGPFLARLSGSRLMSTPTFMFHSAPHDYWRFSEQAVREVFFEGMDCLALSQVLSPIRIVAVGSKRAPA